MSNIIIMIFFSVWMYQIRTNMSSTSTSFLINWIFAHWPGRVKFSSVEHKWNIFEYGLGVNLETDFFVQTWMVTSFKFFLIQDWHCVKKHRREYWNWLDYLYFCTEKSGLNKNEQIITSIWIWNLQIRNHRTLFTLRINYK